MSVEEVEALRIKARNLKVICIAILLVIAGVLVYFTKELFIAVLVFVLGIILVNLITKGSKKRFLDAYKKVFVKRTLETIFDDLKYNPERGLKESIIGDTYMMDMGDRYSSNDYVSGKYKNIKIEQSDVHIEEERETRDSDGHTHTYWVTTFKGKWMIFDFNKKFKANIQVSQKNFRNSRIYNLRSEVKYKKIKMEDELFNKTFNIHAQNEHDAFYVLTPHLIEKIKYITKNINGSLLFCFINNKLHVGIHDGKDSFEHSIFTKINEEKVIEKISYEIKLITDFVDELDLDNNIFGEGV